MSARLTLFVAVPVLLALSTLTRGQSPVVNSDPARLNRIRAAVMLNVDRVIEFHTPEADAVCSALEVFPPDNPWNLVVEKWPLHPNSKKIIASIGWTSRSVTTTT